MFNHRADASSSPWLEGLHSPSIDRLCQECGAEVADYPKDSIIYRQGESSRYVYLVKKGRVRLTLNSVDGRSFHVLIIKPECIFGERAYLDGLPHDTSAEAIIDTQLCRISHQGLDAFLHREPTFHQFLSLSMARKLMASTQVIDNLVMKGAADLVLTYLKYIALAHGERITPDKVRINIRFTHENIASITNLSRVTVSNIISELVKTGLLVKEGGQFYINSMSDLDSLIS